MQTKKSKKIALTLIFCMILQLVLTIPVLPATIAPDGYTLVSTAKDLEDIALNLYGKYRLTNNIALSGYWTPIGSSGTNKQFQGILDGAGYTISGLSVSTTTYGGLFGYTYGATIKNLTLSGTVTASSNYSGSFVGYAKGTLILDSCNSSVTVSGKGYAGGLVGYGSFSNALISNCTFTGSVTGTTNVGGIVGKVYKDSSSAADSKISMCRVVVNPNASPEAPSEYQAQRVTGTTSVGGIVGEVTGTTIEKCYTTVKVYGTSEVGGIAGNVLYGLSSISTIQDCFTTGDIYCATGGNNGGIAGRFYANSSSAHKLLRCYSRSDVYSPKSTQTGGVVGDNGSSTTYSSVSACFAINRQVFQASTSTTTTGRIGGTDYGYSNNYALSTMPIYWKGTTQTVSGTTTNKHGANKTDAELQTQAPYVATGWDFSNVWAINSSVTPSYPVLQGLSTIPVPVPPPPHIVYIDIDTKEIYKNESFNITASGLISGDSVVWLGSSDESVATITVSGNIATVTGVGEGDATISVTSAMGAPVKTTTVKVNDITSPDELVTALKVGEYCNVSALTLQGIEPPKMHLYTWTSSDTNVVTVDSRGKVTAVGLGLAEITGTKGGVAKTIKILVYEPVYPVETITFSPSEITLVSEASYRAVPIFGPADATIIPTLRWSSDNEYVASVSANGLIIADDIGVAKITAKDTTNGEVYGEIIVTVVEPFRPVTAVNITAPSGDILPGDIVNLTADVLPNNASDPTITWSCSPSSVATIDSETGALTAISAGTVTVTAVAGSVTTNITLTVKAVGVPTVLANWATMNNISAPKFYALQGTQANSAYIEAVGINSAEVNASNAIAAKAWKNSTNATPKGWLIYVPNVTCSSFTVEFDQRSPDTGLGPRDFILQYSTDGVTWTDVDAYSISATWGANPYSYNITTATITGEFYVRIRSDGDFNCIGGVLGANTQSLIRKVKVIGIS